jgi:hypothetical protein
MELLGLAAFLWVMLQTAMWLSGPDDAPLHSIVDDIGAIWGTGKTFAQLEMESRELDRRLAELKSCAGTTPLTAGHSR